MRCSARFYAIDNRSGQLAQFTFRIILQQEVHIVQASFGVALIELAQSAYEYKLIAVRPHGEALVRDRTVGFDNLVSSRFESVVSGTVERVFQLFAEDSVLLKIGIGQYCGPFAVLEPLFESFDIAVGLSLLTQSGVEQIQVVIGFVHLFKLWIVMFEPVQCLFAQS